MGSDTALARLLANIVASQNLGKCKVQTKAPKLAMKDKLHVHCAPLKTCRCVLIQPASLVGKQRLNFGKALVVVENCATPLLHNMHMSHVNI